ncbi:arylamine N-acetyltransferase family protein [Paenibacillus beijingensis]|uniref:Acetyltransferase n=1 Tax=Paenibacillus beijingensis TaxID=1126833 RepID=A0A0D5NN72_9BACL|nr:arylamine N-acetyltransferase [Paenibacillus beijingensis]AJY76749.1 acetyltransferase [Paenibacillus beijingensis]
MKRIGNEWSPQVQAYLERIGFDGALDGSAETLALLQERHLYSVPYENLDILRRIPLSLEVDHLLDKIVMRRRGGYCFELNALFGWLLRELGFPVTDLFARFWRDEPDTPPKRRHHVLKVKAGDHDYLCDVGVGGVIPRRPVLITVNTEQQQGSERYRLERDPMFGLMLCEWKRGVWSRIYSFTDEPQLAKDFLMATYWCENAPDSIFMKDLMVSLLTPEGRKTIAGREFRTFSPEGVHTFTPRTEDEYENALQSYFGISLRIGS